MIDPSAPVFCANHPGVETSLRCNKCGKPICARCAVRTPTGYRCKECVRGQQKVFVTAVWYDYILGIAAAGIMGFLSSLLVVLISSVAGIFSWLLIIIGGPTVGVVIAEAVRFATRKHRSRALFISVAVAMVFGALPVILFNLLTGGLFGFSFQGIFGILYQGIFLFICVPVVYTRLSGIQIFH